MSQDKIFADGFLFKRRDNAPEFVIGNISVKVEEAVAFLNTHQKNGWVNLNVLTSQAGKPYVELDTFVPKKQGDAPVKVEEKPVEYIPNDDDIKRYLSNVRKERAMRKQQGYDKLMSNAF